MRKKYAIQNERDANSKKKKEENMRFELEENTKFRFERDGIYIMNSKYQTKEKITDVESERKNIL